MGLMRGIRKNVKAVYWVVIVAVVITFVFWGTRIGTMGGHRFAGIVFDKKVSTKEFDLQRVAAREQAIMYQLRTGRLISPDYVETMAWQRVVELREADRWGISIPMGEVKERIRNRFSPGGHFEEEFYRSYLQSRGLSEQEFAEIARDDAQIGELERLVIRAVVVTPAELREKYIYDKEQKKIKFHMVEMDSLLPAFEVSSDGEQYYRAHTDEFREPKKVAVQYIMVEKEHFLAQVSLTEEELKKYYENNKSSYRGEFDEVKPQIERELKSQKADEMARQQAEKILNFSDASMMREVARKNSLPLGESGLIPEEGAVADELAKEPGFRSAAFNTSLGEVSSIIKTKPGYCVLSPARIVPPRTPPFEEVRKEAAEKEKAQRLREVARYAGISDEDVETLLKEESIVPADIDVTYEDALRYYDTRKSEFMKPKKVKVLYLMVEKAPFEKKVKVTNREINAEYEDSQWKYKDEKGEVKPLAEVREEIEEELRASKADEMARERANEIFTTYRPQRMKQLAQKYGLELRESRLFARGETIDDYVGDSATFSNEAFRTALGEVSAPFSTDIGYGVLSPVQIVDEAVADFEEVAEEAIQKAKKNKAEGLANRIAWELYRQVRDKTTREKKDFETACNELGLSVEESGYFRRDDSSIEKVGATAVYTRQVFETQPDSIGPPKRIEKGSFFYVVSEVKPPSDEEFGKDKESYYDRLAGEKSQQAFQEWITALMEEANVRRSLPRVRRKAAGSESRPGPSR